MALELRQARQDEMERAAWLDLVGFGGQPTRENIDYTLGGPLRPEHTLCAFEDGTAVSQMGIFPFRMRWNGATIDAGGVTAVATLPTHRRRGYLRKLMTKALADMHDRGQSVAILWASMAAIYQRYGYGLGFRGQRCRFDPRLLSFVDEIEVPGCVALVPVEEAAKRLSDCYQRFAEPRTLMLEREPDWWKWQFAWPRDVVKLAAVYEEQGEVLGFAVYFMRDEPEERPGPHQVVNVTQFVWNSAAAHRGLIRYLAGYDLAKQVSIRGVPLDDPLFFQVQEPRLYGTLVTDGLWVRVVDVEQALAQRGYASEGRFAFALEDPLCPWNSGVWRLEASDGHGRVQRNVGEADLTLTPRVLAMLASGSASASTLARAGLIPAASSPALATADRLFATSYAPFCLDDF